MSDLNVSLRIRADGTAEVVSAVDAVGQAAAGAGRAAEDAGRRSKTASKDAAAAAREEAAAAKAAGDAAERAGVQERGRAAAAEKGAQSSRMAAQQAMYLQYNLVNVANAAIASRGNLIAMASPMIDVGMNMGLLSMRGLAAAAGIGAVTVAVGGLIWYAESSDRALRGIQVAMQAVGAEGAELRGEVEALIKATAGSPFFSRREAEGAIEGLVRIRQVGAELRQELLGIAADYAALAGGGLTAADAALELGKAFADPLAGARKLDEAYGILTARQLESIEKFQKQGDIASAQRVLFEALSGRVKGLADDALGPASKATGELAQKWENLLDFLANTAPIRVARDAIAGLLDLLAGNGEPARPLGEQLDEATRSLETARRRLEEARASGVASRIAAAEAVAEGWARRVAALRAKGGPPAGGQDGPPTITPAAPGEDDIKRALPDHRELNAVETQRNALLEQRARLERALAAASTPEDRQRWTDDLERNKAALDSLLTPLQRATRATADARRESRLAANQREIERVRIEAERAALDQKMNAAEAAAFVATAVEKAEIRLATAYRDQVTEVSAATRASLDLADAQGRGGAAAIRQAARNQALSSAAKNAAVDVAGLTRELLDQNAAEAAADFAGTVAAYERQVAAIERVAEAQGQGAAAVRAASIENKVLQDTAALRAAAEASGNETVRKTVEALIARYRELAGRQDAAEAEGRLAAALRQQEEALALGRAELDLMGLSDEARAVALARLRAMNELRALGIDLEGELTDAVRAQALAYLRNAEAAAQLTAETERRRREENVWNELWLNAAKSVQDAFAETFRSIFSGGVKSFGDLARKARNIFLELASQIAALMVFRPAIGGALGGVGLGHVAQQMGMGGEAGGFSLSTLANLGGVGSSLYGVGQSIATSGVGRALGMSNFVTNAEPVALAGANVASPFGNLFADGLAASPWGIVGSMGARLLGLGTRNAMGGAIGGTVGSIAGGMAASALAETALMQVLGVAGGPVGAIIGAFLGTALGGSIGPKPSNNSAGAFIDLASGTIPYQASKGDENVGARDQLAAAVLQVAQALEAATGGQLGVGMVGIDVGTRDGTQYDIAGRHYTAADPAAALAGITRQLAESLVGVSDEVKAAIARIDWTDIERAAVELGVASTYRTMFDPVTETAGPLEQALADLNARYEEALAVVRKLGLEETALAESRDRALAKMREAAEKSLDAEWLEATGRGYLNQLAALDELLAQRRRDAAGLGVDGGLLARNHAVAAANVLKGLGVDQLFDVVLQYAESGDMLRLVAAEIDRREALEGQTAAIAAANEATGRWSSTLSRLRDFRLGLPLGEFSPLNPRDRFFEAQDQWRATLAAAEAGDPDAAARLEDIGRAYLEANRAYWGSANPAAFAEVQDGLARVEAVGARELSAAERQVDLAQRQLEALNAVNSGLTVGLDGIAAALSALGAGGTGSGAATGTRVADLYRTALGREPDQEGLAYWTAQATIKPWEQVRADFLYAARANGEAVRTGFATGGSGVVSGRAGRDNLVLPGLEVSAGELINVTRPDVMASLLAEMRGLRGELADAKRELAAIKDGVAHNTQVTAGGAVEVKGAVERGNALAAETASAARRAAAA